MRPTCAAFKRHVRVMRAHGTSAMRVHGNFVNGAVTRVRSAFGPRLVRSTQFDARHT